MTLSDLTACKQKTRKELHTTAELKTLYKLSSEILQLLLQHWQKKATLYDMDLMVEDKHDEEHLKQTRLLMPQLS